MILLPSVFTILCLCTHHLLFLTSHSFLNLRKAISVPLVSGNCFLKICNHLAPEPKGSFELSPTRLLWSIRCGRPVSAWHTSPLPYFSDCSPNLSPLLVPLPLIILKPLLVTLFWGSCPLRGSTSTGKGMMPKPMPPAAPTFLSGSRPAHWKSPPECHANTSNSAGLSWVLYYSKQVHLLSSRVVGPCLYVVSLDCKPDEGSDFISFISIA